MTSQCFAVSKLRRIFQVKTYAECVILFIISSEAKVILYFKFLSSKSVFLFNYPRKGGNCMTTASTFDNKAPHLSMAARTILW